MTEKEKEFDRFVSHGEGLKVTGNEKAKEELQKILAELKKSSKTA